MQESKTETIEWFIIFTKSELNHWLMDKLEPNFQHCYAMKKSDGGQFWMIVNPTRSHTQVELELVDKYPHPRLYAGPEAVIIPVRTHIDSTVDRYTFCVFNCVEVVKSLLGIKDFWLWTPYQLYKRLKGE